MINNNIQDLKTYTDLVNVFIIPGLNEILHKTIDIKYNFEISETSQLTSIIICSQPNDFKDKYIKILKEEVTNYLTNLSISTDYFYCNTVYYCFEIVLNMKEIIKTIG